MKKYGAMKNKKVKLMKNEQLYRVYDDEDKENRVLYFVTNEGRVISVTKKNGVEKVLKPVLSGAWLRTSWIKTGRLRSIRSMSRSMSMRS